MKFSTISNPNEDSNYHIGVVEDFEYANPLDKIRELYLGHSFFTYKIMFSMRRLNLPMGFIQKFLAKKAESEWQEEYKKIVTTAIPDNLLKVLDASSKKEQIKLLKGLTLTTDEFTAFIIKVGETYGYTFSQYQSSHHHKGFDASLLPDVVEIENGTDVHVVGETTLTAGQLKQAVEHRTVKVSKFFDKNETWHCFFLTYKSLGGKENYKNGQSHLHYISNYWGIARTDVVAQIQSKEYSLPSLPHIDYYR